MEIYNEDEVFGVMPKWCDMSEEKSLQLAAAAVGATDEWILDHAHFFSPISDWLDKKDRYLRRKSFAELAIYLYVADKLTPGKVSENFDSMVFQFVNCAEFSSLIRRHPKQLLLYGAAVNYVKYKKMLDINTENSVNTVLKRKAVWAVERVPHRMLDLWNFLSVYGWKEKSLNSPNILENSCLKHMPDVIESTLHEAYAFTHNLLFHYNFGVAIPDVACARLDFDIEDVVVKLILRYSAEKNFDVVFELIYVAALHKQLPRWLLHYTLCCLAGDGDQISIRGPANPNPDELNGKDSEYIEWAENYHTTLVASSMFRYLVKNWQDFDQYATGKNIELTEEQFEQLYRVGCAYTALSEYELPLGAYRTSIIRRNASTFINKYLTECLEFIKFQKNTDGTFGYWPDEEILYYRDGGSKEDFNQEIIKPVSVLCEQAIGGSCGHPLNENYKSQ